MLAETAQELLELFRAEVKDDKFYTVSSDQLCLWRDAEIMSYMTEACDALATATNGLVRTLSIAFAADATTVKLPRHVLHVYSVSLVNADVQLDLVNENTTPRSSSATGRPCQVYRDADATSLRFYPIPVEADTLQLRCSVTIANALEASDDVPFTKAQDQRLLLEYMKWRAYSKQDSETEDLVRAKNARDEYLAGAVDRESSLRNQRRAPSAVRMDW